MIAPPSSWVAAGLGELFYGGLLLGTVAFFYAMGYVSTRLYERTDRGDRQ